MPFTSETAGWNKGLTSKTSKSVWKYSHNRGPYKHNMIRDLSKEKLEELVRESFAVTQVLEKLKFKRSGNTLTRLSRRIKELGVNTSHFLGPGVNRGVDHLGGPPKLTFKVLSVRTERVPGSKLKQTLFKELLKEQKCEQCGQLPTHNGKRLVLQVHHKDGNRGNNTLENLEILCPNCHTQTPTFTGRNVRLKRLKTVL